MPRDPDTLNRVAAPDIVPRNLPADWRYLGPIPRGGRALVIGDAIPDLESVFEVTTVADLDHLPPTPGEFQLVVLFGAPGSGDAMAALAGVVDPSAGVVLVGLPPRGSGTKLQKPLGLDVASLGRRLKRVGLTIDVVYGALPNARVPEYLFPLRSAAAGFAIERFVLARRPSWQWARRALGIRLLLRLVESFFPGALVLCSRSGTDS